MNQEIMNVQQIPTGTESVVPSTAILLSYDGRISRIFFRESNFGDIFGCKAHISLCLNDLFGPKTKNESIARINSSMQLSKFHF